MSIAIIVAKASNDVIGNNNELIWHLPADLKFFKETTLGKCLLMGRKTYESIGRPLPGRTTIIITRNVDYSAEGCLVASSIEEAVEMAKNEEKGEIIIAGGAEIYKLGMNHADTMYVTEVEANFEGDTYFPPIDKKVWKEAGRVKNKADERNKYDYDFVHYKRY